MARNTQLRDIEHTLELIPESSYNWSANEIDNFAIWFENAQSIMSFDEFECRVKGANLNLNNFIGASYGGGIMANMVIPGQSATVALVRSMVLSYATAERMEVGAERNFGSACGGTNPQGYWKCREKDWQEAMFRACGQYPAGYTPTKEGGKDEKKTILDGLNPFDEDKPFYENPILWLIALVILIVVVMLIIGQ